MRDWNFITHSSPISCLVKLTADVQLYRGTDCIADIIGHIAPEEPLSIAGHLDHSEGSSSVAELYSPTGCDHRAVLQPSIRQGRPVGHRAHENCCVIELH